MCAGDGGRLLLSHLRSPGQLHPAAARRRRHARILEGVFAPACVLGIVCVHTSMHASLYAPTGVYMHPQNLDMETETYL